KRHQDGRRCAPHGRSRLRCGAGRRDADARARSRRGAAGAPARMFVKICGITRPEDAIAARAAGADAIGINFWSGSKRFIGSIEKAREGAAAAEGMATVGVFVNATAEEITSALEVVQLVQLHGDETPAFAEPFRGRYV